MVDDFMVCVDRVIASACFEAGTAAVVGRRRRVRGGEGGWWGYSAPAAGREGGGGEDGCMDRFDGYKMVKKKEEKGGAGEMIECRICQEEGEEGDMEAPCACSGTLKFAHRKCIQRWCNKKGDIICEICNQTYAPNYSIPPSRAIQDCMAIDIRWPRTRAGRRSMRWRSTSRTCWRRRLKARRKGHQRDQFVDVPAGVEVNTIHHVGKAIVEAAQTAGCNNAKKSFH